MTARERIEKVFPVLRKATRKFEIPIVAAARGLYDSDFHVLVTVLLTAQTKDELVARMMPDIFRVIKRPADLVKISQSELQKLIYPVSFYRNKARHLKELGSILIDRYGGKVPHDFDALRALPGVGEKTAYIVLHRITERHEGIGVDVHVHRISNRLGVIRTKTPHQTETALQRLLPRSYFKDYNSIMVKWGQNVCAPVSPWCSKCPITADCKRVGVKRSR